MPSVQLDQNSDAAALADSCNAQGLVQCHRFPRSLRHDVDEAVLAFAKANDRVLFTYDKTIIASHWKAIPDGCPGVVILSCDDNAPSYARQMTAALAMKILAKFKSDFPQWHSASWLNSVVDIKPSSIEVNHVEASGVPQRPDGFLERRNPEWQTDLARLLAANAARPQ